MDIYQAAFESSPDLIVCVNPQGEIMRVNGQCGPMLGYAKGELEGQPLEILLPERFRIGHARHRNDYMAAPIPRPMGTGRRLVALRKDGSEMPVHIMLSPAETPAGMMFIAVLRDLSDIQAAEMRAETQLAHLQLSSEAAGMGYWTYEESTGKVWSDENFARLFGGRPGDFPDGDSVRRRIWPEDQILRRQKALESLAASGKYESEFRVTHPDGSVHWLADLGRHIRAGDKQGRIFSGVTFDVSARKRAEARAEEAHRQERDLMDLAPDGIFLADSEGRYVDVNAAGCRMLGCSREEIVGKTILDFIPPEDIPRLESTWSALLAGGIERGEWKLRRKDGSWVETEMSVKIHADGRWLGFVRDIADRKISERKQAELLAELRESLREIKVLRGLLPICAHCKKIRDEKGTWQGVESYMEKRSELQFSHGICPDCLKEHYAEYVPFKRV